MKTSDFWYDLPEELIAQTPLQQRDSSRLMVLDRQTGAIEHEHFYDILDHLQEGDCLVLNDTKETSILTTSQKIGRLFRSPVAIINIIIFGIMAVSYIEIGG